MRKIHILGFALFVVLAFGAVAAASAFAAHEALVDGAAVAVAIEGLVEGEVTLRDLTSIGNETVDCSGSLDGTIEPGGTDFLITSVLNLAGEAISTTPLTGLALSCEGLELCTGLAELWPDDLPWLVSIELDEPSTYLFNLTEDGAGPPGVHVTCKNIIGGTTEDLCTRSLTTGLLENMAAPENDILATFNSEELGLCAFTGAETGHVEATGLFFVTGKTVSVSG